MCEPLGVLLPRIIFWKATLPYQHERDSAQSFPTYLRVGAICDQLNDSLAAAVPARSDGVDGESTDDVITTRLLQSLATTLAPPAESSGRLLQQGRIVSQLGALHGKLAAEARLESQSRGQQRLVSADVIEAEAGVASQLAAQRASSATPALRANGGGSGLRFAVGHTSCAGLLDAQSMLLAPSDSGAARWNGGALDSLAVAALVYTPASSVPAKALHRAIQTLRDTISAREAASPLLPSLYASWAALGSDPALRESCELPDSGSRMLPDAYIHPRRCFVSHAVLGSSAHNTLLQSASFAPGGLRFTAGAPVAAGHALATLLRRGPLDTGAAQTAAMHAVMLGYSPRDVPSLAGHWPVAYIGAPAGTVAPVGSSASGLGTSDGDLGGSGGSSDGHSKNATSLADCETAMPRSLLPAVPSPTAASSSPSARDAETLAGWPHAWRSDRLGPVDSIGLTAAAPVVWGVVLPSSGSGGKQVRLDGVRVFWAGAAPSEVTVEVTYDKLPDPLDAGGAADSNAHRSKSTAQPDALDDYLAPHGQGAVEQACETQLAALEPSAASAAQAAFTAITTMVDADATPGSAATKWTHIAAYAPCDEEVVGPLWFEVAAKAAKTAQGAAPQRSQPSSASSSASSGSGASSAPGAQTPAVHPYSYLPLGVTGATGVRLVMRGKHARATRGGHVGIAAIQLVGREVPVSGGAPVSDAIAEGLAPITSLQQWLLKISEKAGRADERESRSRQPAPSPVANGEAVSAPSRHAVTRDLALAASLEVALSSGSLHLLLQHVAALLHVQSLALGPRYLDALRTAEKRFGVAYKASASSFRLSEASAQARALAQKAQPRVSFDATLSAAGGKLELTKGGATATSRSSSPVMAVVDRGVSSGRASWTFKLDKDVVNQEVVAFGATSLPITDRSHRSSHVYMYQASNGHLSGPNAVSASKKCVHPGDTVRVEYDASEGSINFWVNGAAQGECFRGIAKGTRLHPAVCFYGPDRTVSVVSIQSSDDKGGSDEKGASNEGELTRAFTPGPQHSDIPVPDSFFTADSLTDSESAVGFLLERAAQLVTLVGASSKKRAAFHLQGAFAPGSNASASDVWKLLQEPLAIQADGTTLTSLLAIAQRLADRATDGSDFSAAVRMAHLTQLLAAQLHRLVDSGVVPDDVGLTPQLLAGLRGVLLPLLQTWQPASKHASRALLSSVSLLFPAPVDKRALLHVALALPTDESSHPTQSPDDDESDGDGPDDVGRSFSLKLLAALSTPLHVETLTGGLDEDGLRSLLSTLYNRAAAPAGLEGSPLGSACVDLLRHILMHLLVTAAQDACAAHDERKKALPLTSGEKDAAAELDDRLGGHGWAPRYRSAAVASLVTAACFVLDRAVEEAQAGAAPGDLSGPALLLAGPLLLGLAQEALSSLPPVAAALAAPSVRLAARLDVAPPPPPPSCLADHPNRQVELEIALLPLATDLPLQQPAAGSQVWRFTGSMHVMGNSCTFAAVTALVGHQSYGKAAVLLPRIVASQMRSSYEDLDSHMSSESYGGGDVIIPLNIDMHTNPGDHSGGQVMLFQCSRPGMVKLSFDMRAVGTTGAKSGLGVEDDDEATTSDVDYKGASNAIPSTALPAGLKTPALLYRDAPVDTSDPISARSPMGAPAVLLLKTDPDAAVYPPDTRFDDADLLRRAVDLLCPAHVPIDAAGAVGTGLGRAPPQRSISWPSRDLLRVACHAVGAFASCLASGPHVSYEEEELSPYLDSALFEAGLADDSAPADCDLEASAVGCALKWDGDDAPGADSDTAGASSRLRALLPPSPSGPALLAWMQSFTPEPPIRRRLGAFPEVELPLLLALALHCGVEEELLVAAAALALPSPPLPASPALLAVWKEVMLLRAHLRAEKRSMAGRDADAGPAVTTEANGIASEQSAVAAASAVGLRPARRVAPSVPQSLAALVESMRQRALFLLSLAPRRTGSHFSPFPGPSGESFGSTFLTRARSGLLLEREQSAMSTLQARWGANLPASARLPSLARWSSSLVGDLDVLPHGAASGSAGGGSGSGPATALSLLHQPGMSRVHSPHSGPLARTASVSGGAPLFPYPLGRQVSWQRTASGAHLPGDSGSDDGRDFTSSPALRGLPGGSDDSAGDDADAGAAAAAVASPLGEAAAVAREARSFVKAAFGAHPALLARLLQWRDVRAASRALALRCLSELVSSLTVHRECAAECLSPLPRALAGATERESDAQAASDAAPGRADKHEEPVDQSAGSVLWAPVRPLPSSASAAGKYALAVAGLTASLARLFMDSSNGRDVRTAGSALACLAAVSRHAQAGSAESAESGCELLLRCGLLPALASVAFLPAPAGDAADDVISRSRTTGQAAVQVQEESAGPDGPGDRGDPAASAWRPWRLDGVRTGLTSGLLLKADLLAHMLAIPTRIFASAHESHASPAAWLAHHGLHTAGSGISSAGASHVSSHAPASRLYAIYCAFTAPLAQRGPVEVAETDATSTAAPPDAPGHEPAFDSTRMPVTLCDSLSADARHEARAAAVEYRLPQPLADLANADGGAPSGPAAPAEDPWAATWAARRHLHRSNRRVEDHVHTLARDAYRTHRSSCDVCNRPVGRGGVASWWCGDCDFDSCESCFAERPGREWWETPQVRDLKGSANASLRRSSTPQAVGPNPALERPAFLPTDGRPDSTSSNTGARFSRLPDFMTRQPTTNYFRHIRMSPAGGAQSESERALVASFRVTRPTRVWLAIPPPPPSVAQATGTGSGDRPSSVPKRLPDWVTRGFARTRHTLALSSGETLRLWRGRRVRLPAPLLSVRGLAIVAGRPEGDLVELRGLDYPRTTSESVNPAVPYIPFLEDVPESELTEEDWDIGPAAAAKRAQAATTSAAEESLLGLADTGGQSGKSSAFAPLPRIPVPVRPAELTRRTGWAALRLLMNLALRAGMVDDAAGSITAAAVPTEAPPAQLGPAGPQGLPAVPMTPAACPSSRAAAELAVPAMELGVPREGGGGQQPPPAPRSLGRDSTGKYVRRLQSLTYALLLHQLRSAVAAMRRADREAAARLPRTGPAARHAAEAATQSPPVRQLELTELEAVAHATLTFTASVAGSPSGKMHLASPAFLVVLLGALEVGSPRMQRLSLRLLRTVASRLSPHDLDHALRTVWPLAVVQRWEEVGTSSSPGGGDAHPAHAEVVGGLSPGSEGSSVAPHEPEHDGDGDSAAGMVSARSSHSDSHPESFGLATDTGVSAASSVTGSVRSLDLEGDAAEAHEAAAAAAAERAPAGAVSHAPALPRMLLRTPSADRGDAPGQDRCAAVVGWLLHMCATPGLAATGLASAPSSRQVPSASMCDGDTIVRMRIGYGLQTQQQQPQPHGRPSTAASRSGATVDRDSSSVFGSGNIVQAVSSEAVALARSLLSLTGWRSLLLQPLRDALHEACEHLPAPVAPVPTTALQGVRDGSGDDVSTPVPALDVTEGAAAAAAPASAHLLLAPPQPVDGARMLGALAVLGGFVEPLRVGSRVRVLPARLAGDSNSPASASVSALAAGVEAVVVRIDAGAAAGEPCAHVLPAPFKLGTALVAIDVARLAPVPDVPAPPSALALSPALARALVALLERAHVSSQSAVPALHSYVVRAGIEVLGVALRNPASLPAALDAGVLSALYRVALTASPVSPGFPSTHALSAVCRGLEARLLEEAPRELAVARPGSRPIGAVTVSDASRPSPLARFFDSFAAPEKAPIAVVRKEWGDAATLLTLTARVDIQVARSIASLHGLDSGSSTLNQFFAALLFSLKGPYKRLPHHTSWGVERDIAKALILASRGGIDPALQREVEAAIQVLEECPGPDMTLPPPPYPGVYIGVTRCSSVLARQGLASEEEDDDERNEPTCYLMCSLTARVRSNDGTLRDEHDIRFVRIGPLAASQDCDAPGQLLDLADETVHFDVAKAVVSRESVVELDHMAVLARGGGVKVTCMWATGITVQHGSAKNGTSECAITIEDMGISDAPCSMRVSTVPSAMETLCLGLHREDLGADLPDLPLFRLSPESEQALAPPSQASPASPSAALDAIIGGAGSSGEGGKGEGSSLRKGRSAGASGDSDAAQDLLLPDSVLLPPPDGARASAHSRGDASGAHATARTDRSQARRRIAIIRRAQGQPESGEGDAGSDAGDATPGAVEVIAAGPGSDSTAFAGACALPAPAASLAPLAPAQESATALLPSSSTCGSLTPAQDPHTAAMLARGVTRAEFLLVKRGGSHMIGVGLARRGYRTGVYVGTDADGYGLLHDGRRGNAGDWSNVPHGVWGADGDIIIFHFRPATGDIDVEVKGRLLPRVWTGVAGPLLPAVTLANKDDCVRLVSTEPPGFYFPVPPPPSSPAPGTAAQPAASVSNAAAGGTDVSARLLPSPPSQHHPVALSCATGNPHGETAVAAGVLSDLSTTVSAQMPQFVDIVALWESPPHGGLPLPSAVASAVLAAGGDDVAAASMLHLCAKDRDSRHAQALRTSLASSGLQADAEPPRNLATLPLVAAAAGDAPVGDLGSDVQASSDGSAGSATLRASPSASSLALIASPSAALPPVILPAARRPRAGSAALTPALPRSLRRTDSSESNASGYASGGSTTPRSEGASTGSLVTPRASVSRLPRRVHVDAHPVREGIVLVAQPVPSPGSGGQAAPSAPLSATLPIPLVSASAIFALSQGYSRLDATFALADELMVLSAQGQGARLVPLGKALPEDCSARFSVHSESGATLWTSPPLTETGQVTHCVGVPVFTVSRLEVRLTVQGPAGTYGGAGASRLQSVLGVCTDAHLRGSGMGDLRPGTLVAIRPAPAAIATGVAKAQATTAGTMVAEATAQLSADLHGLRIGRLVSPSAAWSLQPGDAPFPFPRVQFIRTLGDGDTGLVLDQPVTLSSLLRVTSVHGVDVSALSSSAVWDATQDHRDSALLSSWQRVSASLAIHAARACLSTTLQSFARASESLEAAARVGAVAVPATPHLGALAASSSHGDALNDDSLEVAAGLTLSFDMRDSDAQHGAGADHSHYSAPVTPRLPQFSLDACGGVTRLLRLLSLQAAHDPLLPIAARGGSGGEAVVDSPTAGVDTPELERLGRTLHLSGQSAGVTSVIRKLLSAPNGSGGFPLMRRLVAEAVSHVTAAVSPHKLGTAAAESTHPAPLQGVFTGALSLPSPGPMRLIFDPRCELDATRYAGGVWQPGQELVLYTSAAMDAASLIGRYSGPAGGSGWPSKPLELPPRTETVYWRLTCGAGVPLTRLLEARDAPVSLLQGGPATQEGSAGTAAVPGNAVAPAKTPSASEPRTGATAQAAAGGPGRFLSPSELIAVSGASPGAAALFGAAAAAVGWPVYAEGEGPRRSGSHGGSRQLSGSGSEDEEEGSRGGTSTEDDRSSRPSVHSGGSRGRAVTPRLGAWSFPGRRESPDSTGGPGDRGQGRQLPARSSPLGLRVGESASPQRHGEELDLAEGNRAGNFRPSPRGFLDEPRSHGWYARQPGASVARFLRGDRSPSSRLPEEDLDEALSRLSAHRVLTRDSGPSDDSASARMQEAGVQMMARVVAAARRRRRMEAEARGMSSSEIDELELAENRNRVLLEQQLLADTQQDSAASALDPFGIAAIEESSFWAFERLRAEQSQTQGQQQGSSDSSPSEAGQGSRSAWMNATRNGARRGRAWRRGGPTRMAVPEADPVTEGSSVEDSDGSSDAESGGGGGGSAPAVSRGGRDTPRGEPHGLSIAGLFGTGGDDDDDAWEAAPSAESPSESAGVTRERAAELLEDTGAPSAAWGFALTAEPLVAPWTEEAHCMRGRALPPASHPTLLLGDVPPSGALLPAAPSLAWGCWLLELTLTHMSESPVTYGGAVVSVVHMPHVFDALVSALIAPGVPAPQRRQLISLLTRLLLSPGLFPSATSTLPDLSRLDGITSAVMASAEKHMGTADGGGYGTGGSQRHGAGALFLPQHMQSLLELVLARHGAGEAFAELAARQVGSPVELASPLNGMAVPPPQLRRRGAPAPLTASAIIPSLPPTASKTDLLFHLLSVSQLSHSLLRGEAPPSATLCQLWLEAVGEAVWIESAHPYADSSHAVGAGDAGSSTASYRLLLSGAVDFEGSTGLRVVFHPRCATVTPVISAAAPSPPPVAAAASSAPAGSDPASAFPTTSSHAEPERAPVQITAPPVIDASAAAARGSPMRSAPATAAPSSVPGAVLQLVYRDGMVAFTGPPAVPEASSGSASNADDKDKEESEGGAEEAGASKSKPGNWTRALSLHGVTGLRYSLVVPTTGALPGAPTVPPSSDAAWGVGFTVCPAAPLPSGTRLALLARSQERVAADWNAALDPAVWTPAADGSLLELAKRVCELVNAGKRSKRSGRGRSSDDDDGERSGKKATLLTLPMEQLVIASPTLALQFPALCSIPTHILRLRFALHRAFNRAVAPCLPAFSLAEAGGQATAAFTGGGDSAPSSTAGASSFGAGMSMGARVRTLAHVVFSEVKASLLEAALSTSRGAHGRSAMHIIHTVRLSNFAALESEARHETSPEASRSIFAQAWRALAGVPSQALRVVRDSGQDKVFEVQFEGEAGVDAGGVYREGLQRMVDDLFSDRLDLLLPCPNAARGHRANTNSYLPNAAYDGSHPSAVSQLEFLGRLMGMSLRTKAFLPFAFPSLVWKGLVGSPAGLDDLAACDALYAGYLHRVGHCDSDRHPETGAEQEPIVGEGAFASAFPDARWTVLTAAGAEVELVPGGRALRVTYAGRRSFVAAALSYRLREFDTQIAAIRRGLGTMVPLRALSLFTWSEAEALVAGEADVDVEVLKRHTRYEGTYTAGHAVVKRFWRVLGSMTPDDRQKYLRFVWGRSRLPAEGAHWTSTHTLQRLAGGDAVLPLAHTCFNTIDLPEYTSDDRMRWGLLTAIHYSLGGVLAA